MSKFSRYIEGSALNLLGLVLAVVGIILIIGNFLYYNLPILILAIVLILFGITLSTIGRDYRRRR